MTQTEFHLTFEQAAYTQSMWDEKITDTLNYLFLLNALVREGDCHE